MTTVFVAMEDALVVVRDGQLEERMTGNDLECVAVDPARPERVFCGTFDAGLWRSTDDGRTWRRAGEAAVGEEASVTAVAVSPHDPDVVWAGTEPSVVYRSTDGGDSFERLPDLTTLPSADEWYFPPRPDTHHVRWLEPDPADPDRWYVAIEAGALVRTEDGGESWLDRPEGARVDNHTVRTHPDAPGRVYSAAGDGYAESEDGGDTWHYPQEGLDHRYVWGLATDPGDPDTVVASAASGARRAHSPSTADAHCYRTEGDGWESVEDLPTGQGVVRAVLAAPAEGTFYAATNRGLFRSADAGRTWDGLGIDWPDRFGVQTPRGLAVVE